MNNPEWIPLEPHAELPPGTYILLKEGGSTWYNFFPLGVVANNVPTYTHYCPLQIPEAPPAPDTKAPSAAPSFLENYSRFVRESSQPVRDATGLAIDTSSDIDTAEYLQLAYGALGLASEAGEFAGKVKKIFRDKDVEISYDSILELRKELGDVVWYTEYLAQRLATSLEYLIRENTQKLQSRMDRGALGGSGDDR